jgi:hypothetical protein
MKNDGAYLCNKLADDLEKLNYKDSAVLAQKCKEAAQQFAKEAEERKKRDTYNALVQKMEEEKAYNDEHKEQEYAFIEEGFNKLGDYEDALTRARECKDLYEKEKNNRKESEREKLYNSLVSQISNNLTEEKYSELMKQFIEFGGYKDSPAMAKTCEELYISAKKESTKNERQINLKKEKETARKKTAEIRANILKIIPIPLYVVGLIILFLGTAGNDERFAFAVFCAVPQTLGMALLFMKRRDGLRFMMFFLVICFSVISFAGASIDGSIVFAIQGIAAVSSAIIITFIAKYKD